MTTLHTVVVDGTNSPSTGHFASLYDSIMDATYGASAYNCVSGDEIFEIQVDNVGGGSSGEWVISGATTAMTINNANTSATNYIWIHPTPGDAFNQHANKLTNHLRYNPANGTAYRITNASNTHRFNITNGYVLFEDMQIKHDHSSGFPFQYTNNTNTKALVIRNCIIAAAGSAYRAIYQPGTSSGTQQIRIINTIFYGYRVLVGPYVSSAITLRLLASNFYGDGDATGKIADSVDANGLNASIAASSMGFNFTEWHDVGTWATGSDYNGTNLSSGATRTAPGANSQYSLTATTEWNSVTGGSEDFRINTSATVKTAGNRQQGTEGTLTTLGTNDLDILGQARSTSTPTIGAFEYVAPAGGGRIIPIVGGTEIFGGVVK